MQQPQWDRAERAIAESARLVAESDGLRKDVAETIAKMSRLMAGLKLATPQHMRFRRRPRRVVET